MLVITLCCRYLQNPRRVGRSAVQRGLRRAVGIAPESRSYSSAGPTTFTIADPLAFSFASVVKSRHLSKRAKARYSASEVLAQPRLSAIHHASSMRPFGRRRL